ncbi:MAG: efflux RND transporter permease subunit [Candidatus Auribacterota bacterium]
MNIAEFSIRKQVITMVLTVLCVIGGLISYQNLSRLEDPEFTIKNATIMTPYPGASAAEVAEEVSNVIEKACQELGQLEFVESMSYRDYSVVKVTIKDKYDKYKLPQVWDELRRKVTDYQAQLPPGAGPSVVNDDFGDVYGVYIALTGDGYSMAELKDFAKLLKRELLLAKDVKKIIMYGDVEEVIYVEMNREKMAALGISQQDIYNALQAKNIPVDAGRVYLGQEYIPVNPTGEFESEKEFGELLISSHGADKLVYLKDVASVKRGYLEPPDKILRYNGKRGIGLAISTVLGGNVVSMGESLRERYNELIPLAPLGITANIISLQSESVTEAVNGFVINLVEAVIIVVVVLMIFMGLRSGLIIGFILILTICATFILMDAYHVTLERISLGALIIALGMLVDNAIVITDGMKVKIEAGADRLKAAVDVVGQSMIPLLGATVVAVIAFASIGLSQDSTGEYCRTLFQVILISLMLSWVTAVTTTPLLCKIYLKGKAGGDSAPAKDPYNTAFFRFYRKLLKLCIRFRFVTLAVVVALFAVSLFGFGFVKQMFFPSSTRPQFFVDFWMPEGTGIEKTSETLKKAEEYLMGIDGVEAVISMTGGGEVRFLLTYTPEQPSKSYGQILVSVNDYRIIESIFDKVQTGLESLLPDVNVNVRKFLLGPGEGGKIQLRISGPDRDELRKYADIAKKIIEDDGGAKGIRHDWREKVKVVQPIVAESQARKAGISRPNIGDTLKSAFQGKVSGIYREKDELLKIIARSPQSERQALDSLNTLQIWSHAAQRMIPLSQVVSGFEMGFEDATVRRRDRISTLTIHCDPRYGLASELMSRIKAKIEKALDIDVKQEIGKDVPPEEHDSATLPIIYRNRMPLKDKPGYDIAWGGELESSAKAQRALAGSLPLFGVLMVLIIICLFNAYRQPLIIVLTVPLAIIGVTAGLLLFKQPFGFMSLLGLLSLSGMLIKNAIVLIDQIDLEIREGKNPFDAVVDSGVSRLRPVAMAALTTILGMAPLIKDAFFVSMAVTIMFGLGFATLLTLLFVPVLYAMFFRIKAK